MEITRNYTVKNSFRGGDAVDVLVVDVNNSELLGEVRKIMNRREVDNEESNIKANELIAAQLSDLINVIIGEKYFHYGCNININIYKSDIPLWYWNMALYRVVSELQELRQKNSRIWISIQTDVDRQYYVDNNATLQTFQKELILEEEESLCDEDDNNEFLIKLVLLYIFKSKNLTNDQLEELLVKTSSLGEVIENLKLDI